MPESIREEHKEKKIQSKGLTIVGNTIVTAVKIKMTLS